MAIFRGTGGAGDASANVTVNQVTEKALEAAASATAAASSASDAASSASDASTSEANAATSASNASASASTASTAATTANEAATAAQASETAAETAEANATTAETNAETAQAAAEAAQTAAETAQSAAETAETNAATSASNAATSETNAATSATSASNSATASANSATDAQTAQTAAEAARDSALSSLDSFDDRYLGVKSSDPTLDNDGNALVSGALYFNSVDNAMKVYDGSQWLDAYANGATFLVKANNLSDLTSASTARTNLGLGTAAVEDVGTSAGNVIQLDGSGALPAVDGSNLTNVSSVANLDDLTDVDTTGVADGNTIVYDNDTSTWVVGSSLVNGTAQRYKYTATASQTSFSGTDDNGVTLAYDAGYIDVYLNGVHLDPSDYTATTGTSIVLDTGAAEDDELYIVAFGNFQVADTVSASNGGTFDGNVVFDGSATFNGSVVGIDTDKIEEGNSSVEVVDTGTGYVAVTVDGTETARFRSGGDVSFGNFSGVTTSDYGQFFFRDSGAVTLALVSSDATSSAMRFRLEGGTDQVITCTSGVLTFGDMSEDKMQLDASNMLRFNSGYGSVAIAFGCRAWVNFNGSSSNSGNSVIRGDGNVSTVSDNGTGNYTVNFSNAMPDNNYAVVQGGGTAAQATSLNNDGQEQISQLTTTSFRYMTGNNSGTQKDYDNCFIAVFR